MDEALELGQQALYRREVPVGCVILRKGEGVIARVAGNEANETCNATRHAEMVAIEIVINDRCRKEGVEPDQFFKDCELYVTCEPCIMCADALNRVGIGKVVYGCTNDKFGGCGGVINVVKNFECVGGVKAEEGAKLFQQFYARQNPSAPENLKADQAVPAPQR